jgi:hypothetical protein
MDVTLGRSSSSSFWHGSSRRGRRSPTLFLAVIMFLANFGRVAAFASRSSFRASFVSRSGAFSFASGRRHCSSYHSSEWSTTKTLLEHSPATADTSESSEHETYGENHATISSTTDISQKYVGLMHPAQSSCDIIDGLIQQRTAARRMKDFATADRVLEQIKNLNNETLNSTNGDSPSVTTRSVIQSGYRLELRDIPQKDGGGTQWTIVPSAPLLLDDNEDELQSALTSKREEVPVLQLAHAALGMAVWASRNNNAMDEAGLANVVHRAEVSGHGFLLEADTVVGSISSQSRDTCCAH